MEEEKVSQVELLQEMKKLRRRLEKNKTVIRKLGHLKKRMQILFEYAPDAFYINDMNGKLIDGNQAAEKITGYRKEELIGENFFQLDLLSKEDIPKAQKALEKNRKGLSVGPEEYTLYRKDKDSLPVEITNYPVKVEGKDLVLGIARDISSQKKVEHSYRTIFENTGTATIIIEEDKTISIVNSQAEKLSGYPKAEIENKMKWTDFVFLEDLQKMKKYHQLRRQKDESPPNEYEFRLKDKKGKIKNILIKIDMIPHTKKSVASLMDITKLKQVEEKERHLNCILRTILQINRIIVKEADWKKLLSSVCKKLVKYKGYYHAWVVLLDEERKPKYWSKAGLGQDFSLLVEQFRQNNIPICSKLSLREKDLVVIKNIPLNCFGCPLVGVYPKGSGSMTARLEYKGKVYGVLSVCAPISFIDEPEEEALFREIVSDIAFALHSIKLTENHLQISRKLDFLEKEKSAILDIAPDLIFYQNMEHEIIWANGTACNYLKRKIEDIQGQKCHRIWAGKDVPCDGCPVEKAWKADKMSTGEITTPDGRWWLTTGMPINNEEEILIGAIESALDITEQRKSQEKIQQTMNAMIETISKIIDTRDHYTYDHQDHVSQLAVSIARELKLEGIRIASLIHDIGKIGVPAEILNKPAKLSEIEFDLIKGHPQVGYDILKNIDFPYPVAQIILQHHERIDGSGYPNHLKGDEILLEAKIIGVADVVEAMSSHRPYRPALGIDAALEEITKNRGILYEPEVVDACLEVFLKKKLKF